MSELIPGHAARGFECSDTMIEGAKGFAVSFASRPNFEAGLDGLGKTFEITTLTYKPYPSGVVIHPIIDACLEIADARPLEAAQIERIELTVNPLAVKLTNLVEPKNRGQGLVSMQHWTAAALVHGTAGIAQVTDAVVRDPAMSQLRRKVTHAAVESVKPEAAEVCVVLKDSRILRAGVQHCRGSVGRALTDADITDKTRGQLLTVFPADAAERILAECWRIGDYPRVDALCGTLQPSK